MQYSDISNSSVVRNPLVEEISSPADTRNTKGMLSSSWDGVEAGLLFASILGIVVQWTEEESLQLIEIHKTNAILWDPKHINH
jgi:hypothetical protein